MKQTINAMGLACPKPVILTKNTLDNLDKDIQLEVLVDNEVAVKNVMKFAKNKGLETNFIQVQDKQYVVIINGIKNEEANSEYEIELDCRVQQKNIQNKVVVISSNKMGEGDEKLGYILIKGFIYALTQLDEIPNTVLLYNGGAKLSVEDSESLEDLRLLESLGCEILTCGTCLKHYGIEENLAVGCVTNMYTIAEKMSEATSIIKP